MIAIKNKRKYRENMTVKAGLQWLRAQWPHAFNHIIKIDNEGTTNRAEAVACGLHVGASDTFLAWPEGCYHGLFVEVKRDGWKLTRSQEPHFNRQWEFILKMRKRGYAATMAVGVDELIITFDSYLKGTYKQ